MSQLNLESHIENNHEQLVLQTRPKRFKCKQCEYVTSTKQSLKDHYSANHEGKRYKCDMCEYKASSKITVNTHKRVTHEGITFNCKQCDFKSSSYHLLRNHTQTIHEGIVHSCDKCDHIASSRGTLVTHKKNKHGPMLKCEQCDFECGYAPFLKNHMFAKHSLSRWIESQGLKHSDQQTQYEAKKT